MLLKSLVTLLIWKIILSWLKTIISIDTTKLVKVTHHRICYCKECPHILRLRKLCPDYENCALFVCAFFFSRNYGGHTGSNWKKRIILTRKWQWGCKRILERIQIRRYLAYDCYFRSKSQTWPSLCMSRSFPCQNLHFLFICYSSFTVFLQNRGYST